MDSVAREIIVSKYRNLFVEPPIQQDRKRNLTPLSERFIGDTRRLTLGESHRSPRTTPSDCGYIRPTAYLRIVHRER